MRVAVIGGGISGLTASWLLGRAGHDVVCVDAGAEPGGVMRSERIDGFLCESGPQALLDGPDETRALIADAGLGARVIAASRASRRRFIHWDGRLHALPSSPVSLLRSRLLGWRGKLRLLREPFVRAALPAPGDAAPPDESVLDFGVRRFGDEAARRLLATAVIGIYAGDAARLSLGSALPRLAELERTAGSVIRGVLAMRRSGKRLGHAVSFPDGLQELPRALVQRMEADRVARRIVARATGISRSGSEWRIALEGVQGDASGALSSVAAQAVVLALPALPAAALLEPLAPAAAAALRSVRHVSAAVVNLGFRPGGAPIGLDLHAYGFLVARDSAGGGPALLGCQYESSIFAGRAPEGGVLLRAIVGGTFHPQLLAESDAAIAARTALDLRRVAGLAREPDFVRVWRHADAIPQPELGHAALVRAVDDDLRGHAGLHVIGHALRGVGLNDCIAAAAALARSLPNV